MGIAKPQKSPMTIQDLTIEIIKHCKVGFLEAYEIAKRILCHKTK